MRVGYFQCSVGNATAGNTKMAIVGAAMRKLIHVIYGVLNTSTPFNPKTAAPELDL